MTIATIWSQAQEGEGRLLRQPVQLLRLRGPDTLRFLHGQTSQDLALARPGAWLSTCCITPTARLRALAEVLVEEQGALLVISAGDGVAVRQAFDRVLFPADAVELGPLEEGLWLEPLGGPDPEPLDRGSAVHAGGWQEAPAGGRRLGRALVQPAAAPLPADLALLTELEPWQVEFRRLRLGLPAVPGEINDQVNPFELGLAGRVSLSKGCYVGQETLARLATYDGVKRQLRRWHAPAGSTPAAVMGAPLQGTPLRSGAAERAGVVTSCLALPEGAGWVGLALVSRSALAEPHLWTGVGGAGDGTGPASDGWRLELSQPECFEAPPLGAGGQGAAQLRGGAA
jgi:folate-binding protein YgfZ